MLVGGKELQEPVTVKIHHTVIPGILPVRLQQPVQFGLDQPDLYLLILRELLFLLFFLFGPGNAARSKAQDHRHNQDKEQALFFPKKLHSLLPLLSFDSGSVPRDSFYLFYRSLRMLSRTFCGLFPRIVSPKQCIILLPAQNNSAIMNYIFQEVWVK